MKKLCKITNNNRIAPFLLSIFTNFNQIYPTHSTPIAIIPRSATPTSPRQARCAQFLYMIRAAMSERSEFRRPGAPRPSAPTGRFSTRPTAFWFFSAREKNTPRPPRRQRRALSPSTHQPLLSFCTSALLFRHRFAKIPRPSALILALCFSPPTSSTFPAAPTTCSPSSNGSTARSPDSSAAS